MPDAPYTISGVRRTHEYRLRVSWFGMAIIEEKIECRDGAVYWQRCSPFNGPFEIKGRVE